MSAPKIKIYKLSRDFTSDMLSSDNKFESSDELLPVKDKYIVPDEIMENRKATGIIPAYGKFYEKLIPANSSSLNFPLILEETSNSQSSSGSSSGNSGVYSIDAPELSYIDPVQTSSVYPIVKIDGVVVPRSGYTYSDGKIIASSSYLGVVFTDVTFINKTHDSLPTSTFYALYSPVYDGNNSTFKPFLFKLKDGVEEQYTSSESYSVLSNHPIDMEFLTAATSSGLTDGDYYLDITTGKVSLSSATSDGIFLSYVATSGYAKTYIAEDVNFVPQSIEGESGGHLYMAPDVFVGKKQYEPNSYEDENGTVVNMGMTPCFVDPSNYSLSHRDGSVTFASYFYNSSIYDTSEYSGVAGSVHISYANICAIENVTGQIFEEEYSYDDVYGSNSGSGSESFSFSLIEDLREGDVVFKPSVLDKRYSASIGAMWVGRNTKYMPRNVYLTYNKTVNGVTSRVTEIKPNVVSIDPYDTLTIKTS